MLAERTTAFVSFDGNCREIADSWALKGLNSHEDFATIGACERRVNIFWFRPIVRGFALGSPPKLRNDAAAAGGVLGCGFYFNSALRYTLLGKLGLFVRI